jgi:uncharacterized protein (DUF427 family)
MSQVKTKDQPTITHDPRRIQVLFAGHQVADSKDALVVREPGRPPQWYFPRADVEMLVLARNGKLADSTSKGPATYFTIYREGHVVEDGVWSFESPPPAFQAIAGRMVFKPPHFEFEADGHPPTDWAAQLDGPM